MSEYGEKIRNLKPFKFEEYSKISSREKMAVYAIKYLADNGIPTTFDNVCIACYKFFPDEFKLSQEFPEYPDIAGLNRTLMHLRPSERNLATGKPNGSYELTENGRKLATQVQEGLEKGIFVGNRELSNHDEVIAKMNAKEYEAFINNPIYKEYLVNKVYSESLIWKIFKVIPHTRIEFINNELKKINEYAKLVKNEEAIVLISSMQDSLKKLSESKKVSIKGGKR